MARPTLPAPGASSGTWAQPLLDAVVDVSDRADAADVKASQALTVASQGSGAAFQSGVWLDSYPGSQDAKLTAAMTQIRGETIKRPIFISNSRYDFSVMNQQLYPGFALVCPGAVGYNQSSQNAIPNDIRVNGSGTWFVNPGTTHHVVFQGLTLQGNGSNQFIASNPGVMWSSVFRDCGYNWWGTVWGRPDQKFLNTYCDIGSGFGYVNNSSGPAGTFGGSDSDFFTGKWGIDSPTSRMAASAYHLIFDYQEKSSVGAVYLTAERSSGIWVKGGASTTALILSGGNGRVEGRNKDQPCVGSNIRIDGGGVTIRDWWVGYGATALNSNGHTGEGGVITQTGGDVLYEGLWYDRATGVAETVPFIYVSGGVARVRNIRKGYKGGSWSGLPRVRNAGGTVDADNSVTVI